MKLIAVHVIQRRDAKGQREDIAPGKPFEAATEEGEYLLRVGAARKAGGAKAEPVPEPEEAPVQGQDTTGGDAKAELEKMTKAQLVQFAADQGIEIDESATKAAILDTIVADQAAGDDLV